MFLFSETHKTQHIQLYEDIMTSKFFDALYCTVKYSTEEICLSPQLIKGIYFLFNLCTF